MENAHQSKHRDESVLLAGKFICALSDIKTKHRDAFDTDEVFASYIQALADRVKPLTSDAYLAEHYGMDVADIRRLGKLLTTL